LIYVSNPHHLEKERELWTAPADSDPAQKENRVEQQKITDKQVPEFSDK
jgi:hypothetical protein